MENLREILKGNIVFQKLLCVLLHILLTEAENENDHWTPETVLHIADLRESHG